MNAGDLSHLPFGSPELPKIYYEVEAWDGGDIRVSHKFSSLEGAFAALTSIKTTTLKHIIKWQRPAKGEHHKMRWTQS